MKFNNNKFICLLKSTKQCGAVAWNALYNMDLLEISDGSATVNAEKLIEYFKTGEIKRIRNLGKKTILFIKMSLMQCGVSESDLNRVEFKVGGDEKLLTRNIRTCCPSCGQGMSVRVEINKASDSVN